MESLKVKVSVFEYYILTLYVFEYYIFTLYVFEK